MPKFLFASFADTTVIITVSCEFPSFQDYTVCVSYLFDVKKKREETCD